MDHFTLTLLLVLTSALMVVDGNKVTLEDRMKDLESDIKAMKSAERASFKKLKKQIKREVRNKLTAKILKSVTAGIDDIVQKRVDLALKDLDLDRGMSSEDMLSMFNHVQSRMKVLEDKNEDLKSDLETVSDKSESLLRDFQKRLGEQCNCYIISPSLRSPEPTVPSGFGLPEVFSESKDESVPDYVDVGAVVNNSQFGGADKLSAVVVKEERTFNISTEMKTFGKRESILLVDDEGNMTRVDLRDPSVQGKMATESYVEGITYDLVSKKIFWGSNRGQHKAIFSAGIDGSALRQIQDGKWAFSLAVDGGRRKLFISEWATKTICVMSTNGKNFKLLTDYNEDGDPRNIIVDTKRRTLYVSYSFSVVKMKYDGSRIKRLAEGIWMQPLTLDPVTNTLYYSEKMNIYKLQLSKSEKKATFVNQLDIDLSAMVYYDQKLYIAYQSWVLPVDVLDLNTNALTRFVQVRSSSLLRMCLITA